MVSTFVAGIVLATLALFVAGSLVIMRRASAAGVGTPPVSVMTVRGPHCSAVADRPVPAEEAGQVCDLNIEQAEQILDWREATGRSPGRVTLTPRGFKVSWN
jgi:hypothetical protein